MRRSAFDLYTSEVTVQEARRGEASARRLTALADIPLLSITQEASALAGALLEGRALPAKAGNDALHVAVAAVQGIDCLLTWNYRHIDNAETKPVIQEVCARREHTAPEICTPRELMEGLEDVGRGNRGTLADQGRHGARARVRCRTACRRSSAQTTGGGTPSRRLASVAQEYCT